MPRIEPIPWDRLSDEQRREIGEAKATGASKDATASPTLAYSSVAFRAMRAQSRIMFRQGVIEPRLQELLRLRSAMGNGCGPCSLARKEDSVTEDDVVCLLDPTIAGLTRRERLAVSFLERLGGDYESIDDACFRELAEVFSTAEIVELGWRCATLVGGHRFLHCLDLIGEAEPIIAFDPADIDRTTAPQAEAAA